MAPWISPWPYVVSIVVGVAGWVLVRFRELKSKEQTMKQLLDGSTSEQRVAILKSSPAILRELSSDRGQPGLGLPLTLGSRDTDRDTDRNKP